MALSQEQAEAMALQTPLGRVRGLGSAKGGTHHWWLQRVTSIALLPLTIWFALSAASHAGAGYEAAVEWIARPWNATLLLATVALTFHHLAAGLQVVIEDYVRGHFARLGAVLAVKLASALLALASALAILRIAL